MYSAVVVIILSSGLIIIPLLTTNIIIAQFQNFQTIQIFNGQIELHPRESQGYAFLCRLMLKIYILRETFLHPEEQLKV